MALRMYDLTGADEGFRFSPYCWRVRFICAHKGLALETLPWRFTEKARLPAPNEGTVPVLIDGDRVVSDSWRIALYLDEHYPQGRLLESPQSRGQCLLIRSWADRSLHPFITRMAVRDVWPGLHADDQPYFRTSREKRLGATLEEVVAQREHTRTLFSQALEPLRATLADQPYVGGTAPSLADYILMGSFMWPYCVSNFDVLEAGDTLVAWRGRMLSLFDGMGERAMRNPALF